MIYNQNQLWVNVPRMGYLFFLEDNQVLYTEKEDAEHFCGTMEETLSLKEAVERVHADTHADA